MSEPVVSGPAPSGPAVEVGRGASHDGRDGTEPGTGRSPTHEAGLDVEPLVEAALTEAERLHAERGMEVFLQSLDAAFERAAEQALADPALLERSLRLRRIARRLVPAPLHPYAKQAAAYADELGRRYPVLVELGREAAALAGGMLEEAEALREPAIETLRRADRAARRVPGLHERARQAVGLAEHAAGAGRRPAPARRLAAAAASALRRLAALRS